MLVEKRFLLYRPAVVNQQVGCAERKREYVDGLLAIMPGDHLQNARWVRRVVGQAYRMAPVCVGSQWQGLYPEMFQANLHQGCQLAGTRYSRQHNHVLPGLQQDRS